MNDLQLSQIAVDTLGIVSGILIVLIIALPLITLCIAYIKEKLKK